MKDTFNLLDTLQMAIIGPLVVLMEKYFCMKAKNPRSSVKSKKLAAKTLMEEEFTPLLGLELAEVFCLALVTRLAKYGTLKSRKLPLPLPLATLLTISNWDVFGLETTCCLFP